MSVSSITTWPSEDQPRKKMLMKGREALSDAELMAILLRSGSKKETAVALSQRILSDAKNLDDLGRKPLDFLLSFKGIGEAKAVTIAAALELGRRRKLVKSEKKTKIQSSRDAYNLVGPLISDNGHEEFWIVCLNRANRVICKNRISVGGIFGTVVDPKIIFAQALRHGASSIILYHNHPSGQLRPSSSDVRLTKKLTDAGKILDIKVLDHIIVGHEEYYSFLDENMMDE